MHDHNYNIESLVDNVLFGEENKALTLHMNVIPSKLKEFTQHSKPDEMADLGNYLIAQSHSEEESIRRAKLYVIFEDVLKFKPFSKGQQSKTNLNNVVL